MEIRKESIEDGENGYLAIKISKLIGFFNLIFGELDEEEKALLEEKGIKFEKISELETLEQAKAARVDSILENMATKLGI